MSKALCIGDNCIDYYRPPMNQKFIGGNALNAAIHMKNAGCTVAYMGAVGNDEDGRLILDALAKKGIDVSHCQVFPTKTASTIVQIDANGDRHFLHEDRGPVPNIRIDQEALSYIHQHQLVHNTWLGGTENYLHSFHSPDGNFISMDYGERYEKEFLSQTISHVDIAFFSMAPDQKRTEAEDLCRKISQCGPKIIVVTLGEEGSLAFDGNIYHQQAVQTDVVDTLGAGDTYIATFLAHWLSGKAIDHCMQLAAEAATATCMISGAWEGSLITQ